MVAPAGPPPRTSTSKSQPIALNALDRQRLESFQQPIAATGVAPLAPAVEHARQWQPDRLILITGQWLRDDQVEAVQAAVEQADGLTVDVVMIDEDHDAMRALAERTGGRYVRLAQSQLMHWRRQAEPEAQP